MARQSNQSYNRTRSFVLRALKATVKAVIFYAIYYIVWSFVAPMTALVPSLQGIVETFVIVYIVLMIVGELTAGTIYQHFFNGARALFVIAYLILSLNGGVMSFTYENITLTVNLQLVLAVAILLSLLGLTKSILQGINFLSEKAEQTRAGVALSS